MRAISDTIVQLPSDEEIKVTPEFLQAALMVEENIRAKCYNPNSYDGYRKTWGNSYTYPVHVKIEWGGEYGYQSFRDGIPQWVRLEDFCNAHCKFGSNHLYTGQAAIQILHWMEYIYGVDFTELEKRRHEKDQMQYHARITYDTCNKSIERFLWHKGIIPEKEYMSEDYMVHWEYERTNELNDALDEYDEAHKQQRIEMVKKHFTEHPTDTV